MHVNTHLLKFERSLSGVRQPESLAKTMFTIMVRGLFRKLQFPYAQFPCTTISADLIYYPFWEAVLCIERLVQYKVHNLMQLSMCMLIAL